MTLPHYVFLTGHLAARNLEAELKALDSKAFSWEVINIGVKVAALMSENIITRRLPSLLESSRPPDKVFLPGLCSANLENLDQRFKTPFSLGPKDLRDIAEFLGGNARVDDLEQYDCQIFAEIVDAPERTPQQICQRAAYYKSQGADVIDIGCLPGIAFPHLQESISELKKQGFRVSIDSLNTDEIIIAANAGADYILSLSESSLWVLDEVASTPVLIPEQPGDNDSLYRAIETVTQKERPFYADPVLDPLLMGFVESLERYRQLRQRFPGCQILMGTGNVTELVDADTGGINTLLMAIVAELGIGAVLTTEVSQHACRAIRESDLARRIMYAGTRDGNLPKRYHKGLLALHEKKPFPYTQAEVKTLAGSIKDPNYRVQVTQEGVHVYNREHYRLATDPFDHMREMNLEDDWTHAFYLGVELSRAQIAWQLGKRFLQDNELEWGAAHRDSASPWSKSKGPDYKEDEPTAQ